MVKKIIKCIGIYMFAYIMGTILFSALLFGYRIDGDLTFAQFCLVCMCRNIEIRQCSYTCIVYALHDIVNTAIVAIMTSYIFAYILNREPKLLFPDKLVIRHRTSWESRDKITLGVLIGNRNKYDIHNVECALTFSYIKQEEPLLINSEFTLKEERILLQNYYRFSFDLTKFPRQVLKDIIYRPKYYDKETITVSITGKCNYIGNSFKISRQYSLKDIVYDEHAPNITCKRINAFTEKDLINPFTGKRITYVKWDELNKYEEVGEIERNKSVNEIRYIIKNMKKHK